MVLVSGPQARRIASICLPHFWGIGADFQSAPRKAPRGTPPDAGAIFQEVKTQRGV